MRASRLHRCAPGKSDNGGLGGHIGGQAGVGQLKSAGSRDDEPCLDVKKQIGKERFQEKIRRWTT